MVPTGSEWTASGIADRLIFSPSLYLYVWLVPRESRDLR
jgi:hypothetical protein